MNKLRDVSETIGAAALFIVMCIIFASVVLRYFGIILPDAFDFSRMFLGITIFWGIAGAVAWGSLITADFLYQALGEKAQRSLDFLASLITFVVLSILVWRLWLAVADAFRNGIRTQDIGLSLWYFYAAGAVGLMTAAVFSGVMGFRSIRKAQEGFK